MDKLFLSPRELCAVSGLSIATVRRRIADGTFPATRIGRRALVPTSILADMEAQARKKSGAEK